MIFSFVSMTRPSSWSLSFDVCACVTASARDMPSCDPPADPCALDDNKFLKRQVLPTNTATCQYTYKM